MDCTRMEITAFDFPEFSVFGSGDLPTLYPRFQRIFANTFVSLELIILRESVMTGIILKHNKLFVERIDKNYLLNQRR